MYPTSTLHSRCYNVRVSKNKQVSSWQLLGSSVVFDAFMQIEKRTYQLPDGNTKDFFIKRTQPAVCILALTSDKKIITVKQFRPGPNSLLNELPGGYIDPGESATKAAHRELLEETGYTGTLTLVTECFDDAYSTMRRSCFVATNCTKTNSQNLDASEFATVELIDIEHFRSLARSGQMTDVECALLGLDYLQI